MSVSKVFVVAGTALALALTGCSGAGTPIPNDPVAVGVDVPTLTATSTLPSAEAAAPQVPEVETPAVPAPAGPAVPGPAAKPKTDAKGRIVTSPDKPDPNRGRPGNSATKPGNGPVVSSREVPIQFATVTRKDPSLAAGVRKTVKNGVMGVRREFLNSAGRVVRSEVVREPIDAEVLLGTKAGGGGGGAGGGFTAKVTGCSANGTRATATVRGNGRYTITVNYVTKDTKFGGSYNGSKTFTGNNGSSAFHVYPADGFTMTSCSATLRQS